MAFKVATKDKSRLRLALDGPSGSGKTFTALALATTIAGPKGKVAVIDSERGSASKYADRFRFLVADLESHHPETYIAAIKDAADMGIDVLIIDSLSHAWMGKDGALEQVDKAAARSQSGNSFMAWREVTPLHNKLVDAILLAPMHIIVTMRSKTEYVLEDVEKGGKTIKVPRKIGMAPVQRDGLEYEFDVVGDMDVAHRLVVSKTRCSALSGAVIEKPSAELAQTLMDWLNGPTVDEVLQFVKSEAETCFTVEELQALKKSLAPKGGAYFGEEAKAILVARFEQLKPAAAEPAPAVPTTTEEAGLPMFDDKAKGQPAAESELDMAIAKTKEALARATTREQLEAIKDFNIKTGGVYNDFRVVQLVNDRYFEITRQPQPQEA